MQLVTFCGEQVLLFKKVPLAQLVQLLEFGAYVVQFVTFCGEQVLL